MILKHHSLGLCLSSDGSKPRRTKKYVREKKKKGGLALFNDITYIAAFLHFQIPMFSK